MRGVGSRRWIIALAGAFLAGCSGSAPVIVAPAPRLILQLDPISSEITERLRLFVGVEDADGGEDLARMFLVHDAEEFYWELPVEEWQEVEYGGQTWYGSHDIRSAPGAPFPRGRYRILVEDNALSRAVGEFFLTAPEPDGDPAFPLLVGDRESAQVRADGPVVIRVYRRSGQLLLNEVVAPGRLPLALVSRLPDEPGLLLFVETTEGAPLLVTGPLPL